jgi:hypothetical protein
MPVYFRKKMFDDDVPLHPRVRRAILAGNRDKPLTLNWSPVNREAFKTLDLPKLHPIAERAKPQILAEALAAGNSWISYSRRKAHYAHGQHYFRETYTLAGVKPAVDQLAAAGFVEHEKMSPGHRGMQSRFRASSTAIIELANIGVIYRPFELIVVRDGEGNPAVIRDNRLVRAMRREAQGLNEALTVQRIDLDGQTIREGDRLDSGRAQIQMHRVFNRGSIENGGRWYGPFWQNIEAEDRGRLQINGQQTVELDYVAMHIAMLYQEAGKPLPADPYDLEGWPRDQAKLALLILINARTQTRAVQALADALRVDGGISNPFKAARALVLTLKAKHADIAYAFGSDAGVRLMRRDSDIAARVMIEAFRATGQVPLCIHDGFVVGAAHEGRVREAMENAFPCGTKVKKALVEPTPNFATSYVFEIPKETPERVPQYGERTEPVEGGAGDFYRTMPVEWRLMALGLPLAA